MSIDELLESIRRAERLARHEYRLKKYLDEGQFRAIVEGERKLITDATRDVAEDQLAQRLYEQAYRVVEARERRKEAVAQSPMIQFSDLLNNLVAAEEERPLPDHMIALAGDIAVIVKLSIDELYTEFSKAWQAGENLKVLLVFQAVILKTRHHFEEVDLPPLVGYNLS